MVKSEFETWFRAWSQQTTQVIAETRKAVDTVERNNEAVAKELRQSIHELELKVVRGLADLKRCLTELRNRDREEWKNEYSRTKSDVRNMQTKWVIWLSIGLFLLTILINFGLGFLRDTLIP